MTVDFGSQPLFERKMEWRLSLGRPPEIHAVHLLLWSLRRGIVKNNHEINDIARPRSRGSKEL